MDKTSPILLLGSQPLQIRNILAAIVMPLVGIWLAFETPLKRETALWAVTYYFLTGVGITAGYHRLWSHQAYKAGSWLQAYLSIAGAACFQGSIREWCRDHRAHHRYVDTDGDPYSISKGFWYAHMGWLIFKPRPGSGKKHIVDVTDLDTNRIVAWQHSNFATLALIGGLAFPTFIAAVCWDDWRGGLVYSGILRIFFFQQATFCVNSLAHWLGNQPYDDTNSPRDHLFTALVTFGEGYHNFHHEFPFDYRNGIKWNQYDPSKWAIWMWAELGLASGLRRYSQNVIGKGVYQQRQKELDRVQSSLDWGTPASKLRSMSWEAFSCEVKNGQELIVIDGLIYDIGLFVDNHPGGKAVIGRYVGKDATKAFNGGIYAHSNAAHNLLDDFRFGALTVAPGRWKHTSEAGTLDEDSKVVVGTPAL
ncbi:hypothetical protein B7494_g4795 [Chlorociboria aeruginascens]|nr:hypothetical protein B7494_g4795 [Chlorociboria aeruginascens]